MELPERINEDDTHKVYLVMSGKAHLICHVLGILP